MIIARLWEGQNKFLAEKEDAMKEETKRDKLERKLKEIGLTDLVVFGTFEGEILPAVVGQPGIIIETVLQALEKDQKLLRTFIAMLQGLIERIEESQEMPIPKGWKGQA